MAMAACDRQADPTHEFDAWLVDYVDGEAPPAVCDEVEEHAAECEACATKLHLLERSAALLRQALIPARLPQDLQHRITAAIAADDAAQAVDQGLPARDAIRAGTEPHPARRSWWPTLRRESLPWGVVWAAVRRGGSPRWLWATVSAAAILLMALTYASLSRPKPSSAEQAVVVTQRGPAPLVARAGEPSPGDWLSLAARMFPLDSAVRTTSGSRLAVRLPDGSSWRLNEQSIVRFYEGLATARIDAGEVFARLPSSGSRVVLPRGEVESDGSELLIRVGAGASLIQVFGGRAQLHAGDDTALAMEGESITLDPEGRPFVADAPIASPPAWVEDLGDREITEDRWLPAFEPPAVPWGGGKDSQRVSLQTTRLAAHATYQRLVFDFTQGAAVANGVPEYEVQCGAFPARVTVTLRGILNCLAQPISRPQGLVRATYNLGGRWAEEQRISVYLDRPVKLRVLPLDVPARLVVDMQADLTAPAQPQYAVYVQPAGQKADAIERVLRALSQAGIAGDIVVASDGKTRFIQTDVFPSQAEAAARAARLRELSFTACPAKQPANQLPDSELFE